MINQIVGYVLNKGGGRGTLPMFRYHSVLEILYLLFSQKDAENIGENMQSARNVASFTYTV